MLRETWTRFIPFPILGLVGQQTAFPYTAEFGGRTCRRIRTVFSSEQLQKLEEVFTKQRYMTGPDKVLLASALQLTETQVKVWFQNRRTRWRKSREVPIQNIQHESSLTEDEFISVDSDSDGSEPWEPVTAYIHGLVFLLNKKRIHHTLPLCGMTLNTIFYALKSKT